MSLATTCPNCGTCFRVVQDQLRVSGGWVRCGNCQNVFNALESLFDLDAPRDPLDAPNLSAPQDPTRGVWQTETSARWMRQLEASSWPEPEHEPMSPREVSNDPPEREEPLSDSVRAALHAEPLASDRDRDRDDDDAPDPTERALAQPTLDLFAAPPTETLNDTEARIEPAFEETMYASTGLLAAELPMAPPGIPTPSTPADDEATPAPGDAGTSAYLETSDQGLHKADQAAPTTGDELARETTSPEDPLFNGTPEVAEPSASPPAVEEITNDDDARFVPEAPALPGFVLAAERQARWQRPGARLALGLAMLTLLAGLAGQAVWHWRDLLAATWAPSQPPLRLACEALGCELVAPRRLEALVVDNTTLTRPPGVSGYRLGVHLRNRADHPVAVPSFDLVLTDGQGAVLSRRTIRPEDFDFHQPALEAQAEAQWTLEFSLHEGSLVGYTLAAFYP